jgi:hypothetical protein
LDDLRTHRIKDWLEASKQRIGVPRELGARRAD